MKKCIYKYLKTILIVLALVYWTIFYFTSTYTPLYQGRLSVVLNNHTCQVIKGAYITFMNYDNNVTVVEEMPTIYPFEKAVFIPSSTNIDIISKVLITYNHNTQIAINEYKKKTADTVEVAFNYNGIICKYDGYMWSGIPIISDIKLKPYFRVIDMDGTDWDGHPPLRKFILGF